MKILSNDNNNQRWILSESIIKGQVLLEIEDQNHDNYSIMHKLHLDLKSAKRLRAGLNLFIEMEERKL